MTSYKRIDWSYLLLVPFLALTLIPALAIHWKMIYTYFGFVLWLLVAIGSPRQVHLPRLGVINLVGALVCLFLFNLLGRLYGMFGIGAEGTYETFANLLQIGVPLAIFHLSICNGRVRELRWLLLFCFGCIAITAIMTYLGEEKFSGGSRALTGSTTDASEALMLGIGTYQHVYGMGLFVFPLLCGMSFMTRPQKICFGVFIILLVLAAYAAGYSILLLAMALAGTLYVAARVGLKRRALNLLGVMLVLSLVTATAMPTTLSFLEKPIRSLQFRTGSQLYQERIAAVADSIAGDSGTYVELRSNIYWSSWNVFLIYPVFGGGIGDSRRPAQDIVGGHSTFFDTLGCYGLFGLAIYVLFFVCHYRYMRVMSAVAIGNHWWPAYTVFLFSAIAVSCINTLTGGALLYNLCLFVPALPVFSKHAQGCYPTRPLAVPLSIRHAGRYPP